MVKLFFKAQFCPERTGAAALLPICLDRLSEGGVASAPLPEGAVTQTDSLSPPSFVFLGTQRLRGLEPLCGKQ